MTQLTDVQIAQAAYNAGFRGNDLAVSVARAITESSGVADIRNSIGASGLWQILESAHPEFANDWKTGSWKDPQRNAQMAYQIWQSAGWSPWSAEGGAYLIYMPRAQKAAAQVDTSGKANIQLVSAPINTFKNLQQEDWDALKKSWKGTPKGFEDAKADMIAAKNHMDTRNNEFLKSDPKMYGWNGSKQSWLQWLTDAMQKALTRGPITDPNGTNPIADFAQAIGKFVAFVVDPKNWLRVAEFLAGGMLLLIGLWQLTKNTSVVKGARDAVKGAVKKIPIPEEAALAEVA